MMTLTCLSSRLGFPLFAAAAVLLLLSGISAVRGQPTVDAGSLRGKTLCGYQGWFRCPGDAAGTGWVHWSRDSKRLAPDTLTFEMWPDMTEFPPAERYPVPGFTHAGGEPASLFSSEDAGTVERHFEWMRRYGIDGVWLQHFLVDLPGGPFEDRCASRRRVLDHVRQAAEKSGRIWAVSFDMAGMPDGKIFETLTAEWKKLVDQGITKAGGRYLHEGDRPVAQIWGFYRRGAGNTVTAETANRLIAFFHERGPYQAFLAGGGDWDWRGNPDPAWQAFTRRFDAWSPWNTGNYYRDQDGTAHATTDYWTADKQECEKRGILWLPVVYPGFSWDNLRQRPPGSTLIARRGGRFLWEQFHELSKLGAASAYIAMFDEVDEGTAIFKVTGNPLRQGHFVTLDGLPSDWYLRLTGEGARLLREGKPVPQEIPLTP